MNTHERERKRKFDTIVKNSEAKQWTRETKILDIGRLRGEFNAVYERNCHLEDKNENLKNKLKAVEAKLTELMIENCKNTRAKENDFILPSSLPAIKSATKTDETMIVGPKDCIMLQHHFILKNLLGRGSYGTVFKVKLGFNELALKVSAVIRSHFLYVF